ncbi:hypothetical protein JYU34_011885 [Plutella xylostella]|uniref:Sulfatase N-terminal domain-containing protein n=1 Tax=Plutella xylostella TaxID=51655 RepID=A0ABQ7QDU4_PLUXY|nr:hypothetical protein JYU34_011885 [Plutella xylostella]
MKNVQRFIADNGVVFTNSYAASPICCPSRSSILTGKYIHNHGTYGNSVSAGCYGVHWKTQENDTFAAILHNAGYNTFYAGKYLNEYGTSSGGGEVPPGWAEWHGLVGNSRYYNYTVSNNGVPTYSRDLYLTDTIRSLSLSFIDKQSSAERSNFLMVLAPPAPHAPFTPADRHKGVYANVSALRSPSFNVKADDKHWLIRMPPTPLPEALMPELDRVYRSRWEALLAVDEMVADVVNALEVNNLLEDTYLVFTSDNGYHVGQFAQVYDKRQPYETDIKVPLVISGPGIPKNTINADPVINIDLAPTILSMAKLAPPKTMDGRVIDLYGQNKTKERNMLITYYGEGNTKTVDANCTWKYDGKNLAECYPDFSCKCQDARNNTYGCLRHFADNVDAKYCKFSDNERFEEHYDLLSDPHELTNTIDQLFPSVKMFYNNLLRALLHCSGDGCDQLST